MNRFKRIALRILFALEIFVFGYIYFFGPHGVQALAALESESDALRSRVDLLSCEVDSLEGQLVEWDSNPFYKEKIAREKLQMARAGEEIYFLSS